MKKNSLTGKKEKLVYGVRNQEKKTGVPSGLIDSVMK